MAQHLSVSPKARDVSDSPEPDFWCFMLPLKSPLIFSESRRVL